VRVIGAQLDYLLAPEQPAEVAELLTDPALRIVTLTITEGGITSIQNQACSSPTTQTWRTT
jgi:mannitol-1-phosphate/altronate dehydrogenase